MSGKEENLEDSRTINRVFPLGLFRHVLDYLRPQLLKDTWKKFPLASHVLAWCTVQVKVSCLYVQTEQFGSCLLALITMFGFLSPFIISQGV